jgi:hypothetical protein
LYREFPRHASPLSPIAQDTYVTVLGTGYIGSIKKNASPVKGIAILAHGFAIEGNRVFCGLHVDHTTIYRWVQRYAPELEKRCRPHLKACNDSWKVDETSIKIKKVWMYLYQAVDSQGNTLEFLLSPTRDAEAAKRFLLKALGVCAGSAPHVGTLEKEVTPNVVEMPIRLSVTTAAAHIGSEHSESPVQIILQRGQPGRGMERTKLRWRADSSETRSPVAPPLFLAAQARYFRHGSYR